MARRPRLAECPMDGGLDGHSDSLECPLSIVWCGSRRCIAVADTGADAARALHSCCCCCRVPPYIPMNTRVTGLTSHYTFFSVVIAWLMVHIVNLLQVTNAPPSKLHHEIMHTIMQACLCDAGFLQSSPTHQHQRGLSFTGAQVNPLRLSDSDLARSLARIAGCTVVSGVP